SREPASTHTPTATDRTPGTRSVMTRVPLGNTACFGKPAPPIDSLQAIIQAARNPWQTAPPPLLDCQAAQLPAAGVPAGSCREDPPAGQCKPSRRSSSQIAIVPEAGHDAADAHLSPFLAAGGMGSLRGRPPG